jgi:hypothetical protein
MISAILKINVFQNAGKSYLTHLGLRHILYPDSILVAYMNNRLNLKLFEGDSARFPVIALVTPWSSVG